VSGGLAGEVAVVTGAGSGIGRATALLLAGAGAHVAAGDVDGEAVEATAQLGDGIAAYEVDVTSQGAVEEFRARVEDDLGVPRVLVNCAGWDRIVPFVETDRGFWDTIVAINYLGPVAIARAFLPAMIARGTGGRIINVSSDAGRVGSMGETVYAGAKGGVIAFSKSLAREVARHGITVNCVCPGPTDTPLFHSNPDKMQQALIRAIPFRRLAEPDEIAHAIGYFASAEAGYTTGQVLSVSGGLTMHG
jgi:2-hydroxycyclohexanecarboxyl-CoA dehydrogenase